MAADPSRPASLPRVAVLGAGRIGRGVVANLAGAGYAVSVHDPRPDARAEVTRAGGDWHSSPREAIAAAQVVLTVLPGSPELAALMLDEDGLLVEIGPDRTWIDLTSASPALARRLAATAAAHRVPYLDAPLGGGPDAARSGTMRLYVGGDAAVVADQRPLLATIADPTAVLHVGGAGSGYVTKLLVNLLWFAQAAAHGEALLLGQAAGLAPDTLQRVFAEGPGASAFNRDYVPRLLAGDYVRGFGLDRIVEELRGLVDLAGEQASPVPLSTAVAALYERALARFGPDEGELLAIAELEARAGRQLRAAPRPGPE